MNGGGMGWAWATVGVTAGVSLITAILTAYLTSRFTRLREWEADWRRLKLARYQEFVDATSGLMEGRCTDATIVRFHDAANSLQLVASRPVLEALWRFLDANSYRNPDRSIELSDQALDDLMRAMRRDVRPMDEAETPQQFGFVRPPPGIKVAQS
jgi:hypothetical protein